MNSLPPSSIERLERLTRGPGPVRVREVRIDEVPMTGDLVRKRFEDAEEFSDDGHGLGCRLPNGKWLFVAEEPQTGGRR